MENKTKKVLFIITKGNFGGAQKYVYDLATNLPADKYTAIVACGQGELLKERLRAKKIKVLDLPDSQRDISITKDFKTFFEIKRIIQEERPDILHLNSSKAGGLGALAGRLTSLLSKNYSLKTIFTAHGWAFNEKRGELSKITILFLHWITVLLSHITIAVSEKTKQNISWMPFIKQKIIVIHNGVSSFKTLTKTVAGGILKKEKGQIVIFSLAELHRSKGLDVAIKGLSILPSNIKDSILYYIAGAGEEKETLEKLTNNLGVEKSVKFMGFVENAKELLPGADIFLLPSRNENLPLSILEAGLVGLPIIATSVGGIPEIIKDMQSGILIHKENPKEVAEAITYLIEHKEKQKEFKEEIKNTVKNFFSLEKMLSETINLYS